VSSDFSLVSGVKYVVGLCHVSYSPLLCSGFAMWG